MKMPPYSAASADNNSGTAIKKEHRGAPLHERAVTEPRLTYRYYWIKAAPLRNGKAGVSADRSSSSVGKDAMSVSRLGGHKKEKPPTVALW